MFLFITIFSDSQAAINGINNLINIKQLDFSIVKIKGHSDCKWNDTADYLAKSGIDIALENNNRILDSKSLCSFSFPLYFLPIWSDIAIDRNIWNFTKGVANLLEEVKWSYNGYWANYFNDEQSQIDSNTSFAIWEKTIFEYKDDALSALKAHNRIELTRGLISDTIIFHIQRLISKKIAKALAGKIISSFHNAFRKHVWKPCCDKMIQVKKEAGITKMIKLHLTSQSTSTNAGSSIVSTVYLSNK
ncbi:unnamed protein product [Rhizophagus irregularis]|nr:unnamed protein product [Rhizophagus irregularis]